MHSLKAGVHPLMGLDACLGSGRYPFEGKDALFEGWSASSHGIGCCAS
ncbi:hypothetical protein [Bartonella grahamii]|nr:hypothetical protein [Bartonella grahamii]